VYMTPQTWMRRVSISDTKQRPSLRWPRNIWPFTEPEGLSWSSLEYEFGTYLKSVESSLHPHIQFKIHFNIILHFVLFLGL
jgi:hypothetical protein